MPPVRSEREVSQCHQPGDGLLGDTNRPEVILRPEAPAFEPALPDTTDPSYELLKSLWKERKLLAYLERSCRRREFALTSLASFFALQVVREELGDVSSRIWELISVVFNKDAVPRAYRWKSQSHRWQTLRGGVQLAASGQDYNYLVQCWNILDIRSEFDESGAGWIYPGDLQQHSFVDEPVPEPQHTPGG